MQPTAKHSSAATITTRWIDWLIARLSASERTAFLPERSPGHRDPRRDTMFDHAARRSIAGAASAPERYGETNLLATDQQRSVLNVLEHTTLVLSPTHPTVIALRNGLLSLLGFNGERPDPVTGHYLLGNGYRAFNPVLMRFNSPDSWSPFGEGWVNHCVLRGDPVNRRSTA